MLLVINNDFVPKNLKRQGSRVKLMKVKKEKSAGKFLNKLRSEIKSITAWKIFTFIGVLLIIYLAIRFLLSKVLGFFYAEWGTSYTFRSLSSCEPYFVKHIKFYDVHYLSVLIKYGTWVSKTFYFSLVSLGVYLLLTKFILKEKSVAIKIISIIIAIEVAIIIYLLLPSYAFCHFTAPAGPKASFF